MKSNTFAVLFILNIIFFLVLFNTNVATVEAGCFPRTDVIATTTVEPPIPCLEVSGGSFCTHDIQLDIINRCDEVFLYEMNGKTYEIYNHAEWLKVASDARVYLIYDRSVPQVFGTWTRELRYKNDPSKKITITVDVDEKKIGNIGFKRSINGVSVIVLLATLVVSVFTITKLLNMLQWKLKKKKLK